MTPDCNKEYGLFGGFMIWWPVGFSINNVYLLVYHVNSLGSDFSVNTLFLCKKFYIGSMVYMLQYCAFQVIIAIMLISVFVRTWFECGLETSSLVWFLSHQICTRIVSPNKAFKIISSSLFILFHITLTQHLI
jgi:hypothetical protein